MVEIRKATDEDQDAIADIYNDVVVNSVATLDTELRDREGQMRWWSRHGGRHPVLVAVRDGEVLGWASLSRWSDREGYSTTAELSVFVKDGHKGEGLGKGLMGAVLAEGERAGVHAVVSRIADGNEGSIRLHELFGFDHVGVQREAGWKFGRWVDVVIMQKTFNQGTPGKGP